MPLKLVHDGGSEREKQMFGMSEAEVRDSLNRAVGLNLGSANNALGHIITDVQELIAVGTPECLSQAKQALNRVKLALFLASPMTLWKRLS